MGLFNGLFGKKDDEQIFIHAQKDLDMRIKKDRREVVANDRHTFIQRDKRECTDNLIEPNMVDVGQMNAVWDA